MLLLNIYQTFPHAGLVFGSLNISGGFSFCKNATFLNQQAHCFCKGDIEN